MTAAVITPSGNLGTRNGAMLIKGSGELDCCCGVNCCAILIAFDTLEVTGDVAGNPIQAGIGGELCWSGEVTSQNPEYSVEDFSICCVDGVDGLSGKYRIRFSIGSSAPCQDDIDISFDQTLPCCPLDRTFTISTACGTVSFRVQTPSSTPCPEA